jgi:hypothetical protein
MEPKKYHEAWDHLETYQHDKWRKAMKKEFKDIKTRKVNYGLVESVRQFFKKLV